MDVGQAAHLITEFAMKAIANFETPPCMQHLEPPHLETLLVVAVICVTGQLLLH